MQFRFVFGLVGVDGAQVLFGLHLVATFHGDVFEVGIYGEILAVAQDHHGVGSRQFGDAGHLAVEDGTGLGVLCRSDVDAVVGHGDFVGHHGRVFSV